MQLANELQRERHVRQALDPVAQRGDTAAHLAQMVARHARGRRADLVEQKIGEAYLGALDTRRAERFLALEGRVEQLRVGQLAGEARELAQRGVGARQGEHEVGVVGQAGGEGRRHEGRVAFGAGDHPAGLRSMKVAGIDDVPSIGWTNRCCRTDLKVSRSNLTKHRLVHKRRARPGVSTAMRDRAIIADAAGNATCVEQHINRLLFTSALC